MHAIIDIKTVTLKVFAACIYLHVYERNKLLVVEELGNAILVTLYGNKLTSKYYVVINS